MSRLRVRAELPKFGQVHKKLMDVTLRNEIVLSEIDRALAVRRTPEETAALKALRADCLDLKEQHRVAVKRFVDALVT